MPGDVQRTGLLEIIIGGDYMSKYDVLADYLKTCGKTVIRLSFDTIEEILGFKLPQSAHKFKEWWSNNDMGHSHAAGWLGANYKVSNLSQTDKWVEFTKE